MSSEDDDEAVKTGRRKALSPLLSVADFRPLSASVRVEIGASSRTPSPSPNTDHYVAVRLSRQQETLTTSLSAADLPARFEEHGYAMLVADGLGERGAGSVASRVALSTIAHLALQYGRWNLRIDPVTAWEIVKRIEWFYTRADAAVSEERRAHEPTAGIATALTAAFSAGDDLFLAHVGHSRAYLFREGALIRLTRDDTIEQQIRDKRHAGTVEGRAHDFGHILTDALGASSGSPLVEVEQFRLRDNDCILLCTNGLTDEVDEDQIADILALRRRPQEQCAILTDLVGDGEGHDNVTVVVAQYRIPQT
jgi:serine/threonine protein phosphatase PrpC